MLERKRFVAGLLLIAIFSLCPASFADTVTYIYDDFGRLTYMSNSEATKLTQISYLYDNVGNFTNQNIIVLDTSPPELTLNPVTTPTNNSSQSISGTREADAIITLSTTAPVVAGPVAYPSSTTWSCTISGLAVGSNTFNVTATDLAGNSSISPVSIVLLPTLTVNKTGTGVGTVTSSPGGISCGSACSSTFTLGTSIILTASSDASSLFAGWTGACTGLAACTITMDAAKTVTATFNTLSVPAVSIISPTGWSKNHYPLLQYTVSAGTVVVKVDGVVVNKVSGNTLNLLADGPHTIRVEATNNGVTGFAETTVTIDTILPLLTVNQVVSPTKTLNQTITGTVEAGAGPSVESATGSATVGPVSVNAGNWSCMISNLSPGVNNLTVTALDLAKNSTTAKVSIYVDIPAAYSDAYYNLAEVPFAWEGTDSIQMSWPAYGSLNLSLFNMRLTLYGKEDYMAFTDLNGNVWFDPNLTETPPSFDLPVSRHRVISAWNNKFFRQPIYNRKYWKNVWEWLTETVSDTGSGRLNNFEVVLSSDGSIRIDYKNMNPSVVNQNLALGSGISMGDGTASVDIIKSFNITDIRQLNGRSFLFTPKPLNNTQPPAGNLTASTSTQTFTINNANTGVLDVNSLSLSGPDAANFTITGTTCTSTTGLVGSETCTVQVTFNPAIVTQSSVPASGPVVLNRAFLETSPESSTSTSTTKVATLIINTNDVTNPVLAIPLNGRLPQLIVSKPGNGSGMVTSNTAEISCGSTCIATGLGTSLTLTATPDLGSTFTGWSGACSGTGTCTVTLDTDKTVSATFSALPTPTPLLGFTLTQTSIAADYAGTIGLTINNVSSSGYALVEQLVDKSYNGNIDAGDYLVRSFWVFDDTATTNPNVQGDEDINGNYVVGTTIPYLNTNDIYHAPGHYIFRASSGTQTVSVPFTVTPVSQTQTISGQVTDGVNPVPGALIQLTDRWQKPVTWAVADNSGSYILNVKQPGDYNLLPLSYGYIASPMPITLGASQNIVNRSLTLTAGTYHITGNLKNATSGIGIEGVWVRASDGTNSGIAITNSNGVYDLVLPSGQYSISVMADSNGPGLYAKGYVGFNNQPLHIAVNGNVSAPDILMTQGDLTTSGRVLDTTGTPLPGLPVMGRIKGTVDSREPMSFGISDASGNYSLGLFAGTWDIALDIAAAQVLGYVGTVRRDLSTSVDPLAGNNLTVQPITAWVQGAVKNSANQLLPGVEVKLRNADSSITASVVSGSDGTYRLGVFAGSWFIDAPTEGKGTHPMTEQSFTLTNGQTTTIDFLVDVIPPTETINPVVSPTKTSSQTVTGTKEAGSTIKISVNTAASVGSVSYPTSTTWNCTITGLVEGTNTVSVTATDMAENTSTVTSTIVLDINHNQQTRRPSRPGLHRSEHYWSRHRSGR